MKGPLQGFYFLQLEPDFMADKGLDIEAYYQTTKRNEDTIFDNYYILETILTAPHPMVTGFDDNGEPVYEEETRSEKDIQCMMRVQKGIEDYFQDYLCMLQDGCCNVDERVDERLDKGLNECVYRRSDRKLDELFLELIHSIQITDEDFLSLIIEDPFFNRMTDISDVLL